MSLLSRFFPTSSSLQVMVAVIFPHVTTAEPLLKDIFQPPAINVETHEYVDLNAVLLVDISTSHSDEQIRQVQAGLESFLLSDESMLDYSVGVTKAITVVSFSGDTHTSQTQVIKNLDEAEIFIDEFVFREPKQSCDLSFLGLPLIFSLPEVAKDILPPFNDFNISSSCAIGMSDGRIVYQPYSRHTPVIPAIEQAQHIFNSEAYLDIQSERRVAVFVGDHLFEDEASIKPYTEELTREFGVQVCSIVTNIGNNRLNRAENINTQADIRVPINNGYDVFVRNCPVAYANSPDEISSNIQRFLSFSRF